jgi:tRNA pseudouridine38-40 synthase
MRLALLIEYNGKKLHGSQYQLGVRTVQDELEKAVSAFLREPARLILSGRTDSGVHAQGQVAHFDCSDQELDLWRFAWALNGILKDDISVKNVQIVPANFHARHSALSRLYVYRILNRSQRSALLADKHYFLSYQLDCKAMQKAVGCLVGSHDFASFKSSSTDRGTTMCNVYRAELLNLGEGLLEFWIEANHFVYNMVRIIVGTLIEIGLAERSPESLQTALQGCDRNLTGPTSPALGLTLVSITYPEEFQLFPTLAPFRQSEMGRLEDVKG